MQQSTWGPAGPASPGNRPIVYPGMATNSLTTGPGRVAPQAIPPSLTLARSITVPVQSALGSPPKRKESAYSSPTTAGKRTKETDQFIQMQFELQKNHEESKSEQEIFMDDWQRSIDEVIDRRKINCVDFDWHTPVEVVKGVYLGDHEAARNLPLLAAKGIDHVLNCAPNQCSTGRGYYPPNIIKGYKEFTEAKDEYGYQMLQHRKEAEDFLKEARLANGTVLIHCFMGVNRSATIVVAHLMASHAYKLIDAVQKVFSVRPVVLSNSSFKAELIQYAQQFGMLE